MSGSSRRRIIPGEPSGLHGRVTEGFSLFAQLEASGAILMLAAAVAALIIANSPLSEAFNELWHTYIGVFVNGWEFKETAIHWVNDGLMALFFFVVGLEIKREMIVGELSQPRKAILPILAALGGMIVPALIYVAINFSNPDAVHGWGVPMATDIAFALGVLALLGSRVPNSLRIFLAALAIADDIGAILVIAIFYTSGLSLWWLGVAGIALAVMIFLNRYGVDSPVPYFLVGLALWFATLNSGVHATIAGVVAAFAIPATARLRPDQFALFARGKIDEIEEVHDPNSHVLESETEAACAFDLREAAKRTTAPLQRLEYGLAPISTYFVLPLFALGNAGVTLVGADFGGDPGAYGVMAGVALGLAVGKPLGITLFTWFAIRLGFADLPGGCSWRHVIGAGLLGGIGFTVALFVANLAFENEALLSAAKIAILATSVVAGTIGYIMLRTTPPCTGDAGDATSGPSAA